MITIQRLEDTIKFTFDNNPLYLHDGTIEVPVNSLSLLIDESDIATFLKAASNDIFLSCSLDELNMSKEELLIWYKENATGGGSIDPEEVEEIVEEVTENLFGYAEYDSNTKRINFKHDSSGSVIDYIDASDFVIDGMIDNVEIVEVQGVKYLKITFNTESGKEPILIPLSDIFDSENYYTKNETDTLLADKADSSAVTQEISAAVSGKVDTSVFDEKERIIASSLIDLDERKLDASAYTPTDLSNYYTKTETDGEISAATSGHVDTSAITSSVTSTSTDAEIPTAKAVYDAIGGGKAIEAGRGITVTTGTTADTISFSLPISAGTGTNSLILGYFNPNDSSWNSTATAEGAIACGVKCKANSRESVAIGYRTTASGLSASVSNFAQGYGTTASGNRCHSEGLGTISSADASHSEGHDTIASGDYSHAEGENVNATNIAEHSQGRYNVSNKANTTWGDSGNTLFSVGNGTADNARHNAFEIRQNGDIYITSGGTDIKLQDNLGGGGGGGISSAECQTMIDNSISGKVDTSAITTSITSVSTDAQIPSAKAVYDKLGGLSLVKLTQSQYDALSPNYDNNTLYVIVN